MICKGCAKVCRRCSCISNYAAFLWVVYCTAQHMKVFYSIYSFSPVLLFDCSLKVLWQISLKSCLITEWLHYTIIFALKIFQLYTSNIKVALSKSEFLQNYAPSGDKRNCNQRCAGSWTKGESAAQIFCYSHNVFRGNRYKSASHFIYIRKKGI